MCYRANVVQVSQKLRTAVSRLSVVWRVLECSGLGCLRDAEKEPLGRVFVPVVASSCREGGSIGAYFMFMDACLQFMASESDFP